MLTASAAQAQALVRDSTHFQWYLLALLLVVVHAYHEQIAARRWNVVLGGLAFWLMDWLNEIVNALIGHFSGFAPLWSTPGASAYVLLIGLNVEISFTFALMGLLAVRLLPARRRAGPVDTRRLFAVVSAASCVAAECWLNHIGVLVWEWRGWNAHAPWLIFVLGYLPFFGVAYWVHDMPSRRRQLTVVGTLATLVATALAVFAGVLGWI